MKLRYFFGLVLISLVIKENEAHSKDQVVSILTSINNFFGNFANQANKDLQYMLDQNMTRWEEKTVELLVEQVTSVTSKIFSVINALDSVFNSTILTCVIEQEPTLLQGIKNSTEAFGWCSTQYESNLIVALRALTKFWVEINADLKTLIDDLKACNDDDIVCIQVYGVHVKAFIKDLIEDGRIAGAYQSVKNVSEIIYHLIIDCENKKFIPQVLDDVYGAALNVLICSWDI